VLGCRLNDLNFVIYPGKVSNADCFRIGHIGRVFPQGKCRLRVCSLPPPIARRLCVDPPPFPPPVCADTKRLADAIRLVCKEMKTAKFYRPDE
jgi:hypothetical protein